MLRKSLITRIERLEQAARAQSRFSAECICFRAHEPPFFGFPVEEQIAAKVKCPLHGERFKPLFHLYVPGWRRESEKKRWPGLSQQYHKGMARQFPAGVVAGRGRTSRGEADVAAERRNDLAELLVWKHRKLEVSQRHPWHA
jgi:hypothetical protein